MALFTLHINCKGIIRGYTTQLRAEGPYDAIRVFLKSASLNEFLSAHQEWPCDFQLRDIYLFIPLEGLTNVYFCGLGQRGKYIHIDIVQTTQRSSQKEKYCGSRRKRVTLR
jgi:hypothetical protein